MFLWAIAVLVSLRAVCIMADRWVAVCKCSCVSVSNPCFFAALLPSLLYIWSRVAVLERAVGECALYCSHGPCQARNVSRWKNPTVRAWPTHWGSRELIRGLLVGCDWAFSLHCVPGPWHASSAQLRLRTRSCRLCQTCCFCSVSTPWTLARLAGVYLMRMLQALLIHGEVSERVNWFIVRNLKGG